MKRLKDLSALLIVILKNLIYGRRFLFIIWNLLCLLFFIAYGPWTAIFLFHSSISYLIAIQKNSSYDLLPLHCSSQKQTFRFKLLPGIILLILSSWLVFLINIIIYNPTPIDPENFLFNKTNTLNMDILFQSINGGALGGIEITTGKVIELEGIEKEQEVYFEPYPHIQYSMPTKRQIAIIQYEVWSFLKDVYRLKISFDELQNMPSQQRFLQLFSNKNNCNKFQNRIVFEQRNKADQNIQPTEPNKECKSNLSYIAIIADIQQQFLPRISSVVLKMKAFTLMITLSIVLLSYAINLFEDLTMKEGLLKKKKNQIKCICISIQLTLLLIFSYFIIPSFTIILPVYRIVYDFIIYNFAFSVLLFFVSAAIILLSIEKLFSRS